VQYSQFELQEVHYALIQDNPLEQLVQDPADGGAEFGQLRH
jgi:hypothetical protein